MNPNLDLPGYTSPTAAARQTMNFRQHVAADVATWPAVLREAWEEIVRTSHGGAWLKFPVHEVELRAWVELRQGEAAREPVVLNRHHLTPCAPQAVGRGWPVGAVYAGRAPGSAPALDQDGGEAWRVSHLLGNPWDRQLYPDALERYRLQLRRWLYEDSQAAKALAIDPRSPLRRVPAIDAIRDLSTRTALVCSCVTSPWSPVFSAPYPQPLPAEAVCHCHLIVATWRALHKPARAAAQPAPGLTAPA